MSKSEELTLQSVIELGPKVYEKRMINGDWWFPPRLPKNDVQGKGLMLILSHPTKDDLSNSSIATGAYKEEINNALTAAEINPDDVYITTMVKLDIKSKPKPSSEQIEICASTLDYEIEQFKPKLIMTLGAETFKRIMKTNIKQ